MTQNSQLRKMDRARTLGLSPEEIFDFDDEQELDQLYYQKLNQPQKTVCSSCKGSDFLEKDDQIVCEKCFCVQSSNFEKEVNNDYNQENQGSHYISKKSYDLYGNKVLGGTRTAHIKGNPKLSRLQNWQSLPDYPDQELMKNLDLIESLCKKADISENIISATQELFLKVSVLDKRKGKKKIQQMAACFFLICQNSEDSRAHYEVANIFKLKKPKDVCNGLKNIPAEYQQTSVSTPFQFLNRFNNHLKLNSVVISKATYILTNIQQHSNLFTEFTPQHMCLSVLYYICVQDNIMTEQEFCQLIKKSDNQILTSYVTLNKQSQKISSFLKKQQNSNC